MLTDPGSITKTEGAITKLADAENKLCDVQLAPTTSPNDKASVITVINSLAANTQVLSLLLPPPPVP